MAAEAAGADLLIVTATHDQPIQTAHATLAGYDRIVARLNGDLIQLQLL